MNNYIINFELSGFEKLDITDFNKIKGIEYGATAVIVMTNSMNRISNKDIYNGVNELLKKARVILICSEEDEDISNIFRQVATLMIAHGTYDIYSVVSSQVINASYIREVIERKAGYSEVQTFLDGELTGYSEINIIIQGLTNLVEQGDVAGLEKFITENINSIDGLVTTIDYMKHVCELYNTEELSDKIRELETSLNSKINELNSANSSIEKIKERNIELENKLKEAASRVDTSANEICSTVFKNYQTLDTAQFRCNTKYVLYFKELSYIRYENSMLGALAKALATAKYKSLKVKMVVFDDNVELIQRYNDMPVITGSTYNGMKDILLNKNTTVVVAEPATHIIRELLSLEDAKAFDAVIIVDRMKMKKDIVKGNNVSKFYFVNSSSEYKMLNPVFNIDLGCIITSENEELCTRALRISTISEYNKTREEKEISLAQLSKYIKLGCGEDGSNQTLFNVILAKAHVLI